MIRYLNNYSDFRFCVNHVSNTLTPRTAEKYLNEAAAIPDQVHSKMSLIKPLLHWVGDNISTLRDRHLLNNIEKPALILLGMEFNTVLN